ncbi:hypothetical protein LTR70_002734 [Exophiala xenobiotica]|uniref:Small ribosomal subunit protein bS18m n=1 Tax=Lithohypha guttulata TaxID=1690604 RepID=A0ABR0KJX1_9EURO|nr:hypothetical protein LTR24_001840 [Lithohypha guttulata]KAK5324660.1 hypothetical protein LTR70_002734 [Exophiala xenobiotica]
MAGKRVLGFLTQSGVVGASSSSKLASLGGVRYARSLTRRPASRQAQEERTEEARAMERNFTRDWKPGDVYAPHDLSAAEARKWRAKKAPTTDAFDVLSLNPLDLYKNFSVMSEYITDQGRIRPRSQTGLRPVNQRRLAKAIRRAQALGLMPSVHKHPEIMRKEQQRIEDSKMDRY